jgi:uncharacterized membrane protein
MKKDEFIQQLSIELKKYKINDIDEIILDFEEHFAFRLEEGRTEEEIAKKIGNPVDIAKDYLNQSKTSKSSGSTVIRLGLIITDFFVYLAFLIMWLSVIVLGAFALVMLTLGVLLLTTANIANLIPEMPYLSSFLLSISSFALAVVSCIGTIYLVLYILQWQKAYLRWHKNMLNRNIYPPLSKHPKLSKRSTSILKLVNMFGIIIFVSTLIIGYLISSLLAGSFEFWHVWNWFV